MPKVRKAELSFLYATCRLVLFYISAKYHQNIPKGIQITERTQNLFQIKQSVITPKVTKAELSFLYVTCRLDLFYVSTKYHQNIPKGIQVTEQTRSLMPMPTLMPTGSVPKTICPPRPPLVVGDIMTLLSSLNRKECVRRLLNWREAMQDKGLRVNAGKKKIMICGTGPDLLQSSGKFPCTICRTGVGSNSIFCNGCKHWVHAPWMADHRGKSDKLEVAASFCYLRDMLSAAGGCELSTTTHVKTAWKKFKELLLVLSSRHFSFKTRGHMYSSCEICVAQCSMPMRLGH